MMFSDHIADVRRVQQRRAPRELTLLELGPQPLDEGLGTHILLAHEEVVRETVAQWLSQLPLLARELAVDPDRVALVAGARRLRL